MPAQNSLLQHLQQLVQHPSIVSGTSVQLEALLVNGKCCMGPLHAVFDDGFAIMEVKKITYIPLAGLASVTLHHPGYSKV